MTPGVHNERTVQSSDMPSSPDPSPSRDAQLQSLVFQCLDRFETEGDAAIEAVCAEHPSEAPAIRQRIQALRDIGMLGGQASSPDFEEQIPSHIGKYRIVRKLGTGGMGIVFEAEQDQPKRSVALKVVRSPFLNPDAFRRFHRETHLLGLLQHSGIAAIYEAGQAEVAPSQVPYFAMELVRGESLDRFVSDHELGIEDRLRLVARICDAVHHAHQKGVIHRDLKPSNISIDSHGQPKILDFGLARAIDPQVQLSSMHTDVGQVLGTLPYMSPEQASGDDQDLDVRTDVYSIGVILYELLAGSHPCVVTGRALPEALRIIQEQEPARLGTVHRDLRGDIETIVSKCLEKERERRYPSASELGADLRRFLHREPIEARSPSSAYQIKRFVQRHRGLVAGLVTAFLLLLAGATTSTIALLKALEANRQTERAREQEAAQREAAQTAQRLAEEARAAETSQRQQAERQAAIKGEVLGILSTMLAAPDPWSSETPIDRELRVLDVFDDLARSFDERSLNPEVELECRKVLAGTFRNLGDLERAEAQFERIQSLFPSHSPREDVLAVNAELAALRHDQGRYQAAVDLLEACVTERRKDPRLAEDLAKDLNDLALASQALGDHERAKTLYKEAIQASRAPTSSLYEDVPTHNLGVALRDEGELSLAQELLERALALRAERWGDDHVRTLTTLGALAVLHQYRGDLPQALEIQTRLLDSSHRVFGSDHYQTITNRVNFAMMLSLAGDLAGAQQQLRQIEMISGVRERYPLQSIRVQTTLSALLVEQGALAQAVDRAERAMEAAQNHCEPGQELWAGARATLGRAYAAQGSLASAIPVLEKAGNELAAFYGEGALQTIDSRCRLMDCYLRVGDSESAVDLGEQLLPWEDVIPEGSWLRIRLHQGLGQGYRDIDLPEDAELHLTQAFEISQSVGREDLTRELAQELARVHEELGNWNEAERFRAIR